MKLLAIAAAAGLVAGTIAVPPPADAARYGWKTVCKTRWHRGHRVRKCTRVRIYRDHRRWR